METTFDTIKRLTEKDLQHKTVSDMVLSLLEEAGEFSRELKIEEKVFGNQHKVPDEGTKGEAADMVIMTMALFAARGGSFDELVEIMTKKLAKWERNQVGSDKTESDDTTYDLQRNVDTLQEILGYKDEHIEALKNVLAEYREASDAVRERLVSITNGGGDMEQFLAKGSIRELVEARWIDKRTIAQPTE